MRHKKFASYFNECIFVEISIAIDSPKCAKDVWTNVAFPAV